MMNALMSRKNLWAASLASALAVAGCGDAEANDWASTGEGKAAAQLEVPDGGAVPVAPVATEDLGKGDGKDVVTIGDSWMSLGSVGIQQSLVKLSGQRYRTYGVGGTRLLNGQIPNQYARAKREDPDIKTVVMTGGGNDVLQTGLQSDCASGGSRCTEQLDKIGAALKDLWLQMGQDGVRDVVHVLYSSDAGRGVKDASARNQALAKLCAEAAPVRCHLLPTDDLVRGELRPDDIHPSNAAYDRIARGVLDLLEKVGARR
jgi:lysophospholipase L1-like esterase